MIHASDEELREVVQLLQQRYPKLQVLEPAIGVGGFCTVYHAKLPQGGDCAVRISNDRLTSSQETPHSGADREQAAFRHYREHNLDTIPYLLQPIRKKPIDPPVRGHFITLWQYCNGGSLDGLLDRRLQEGRRGLPAAKALAYIRNVAKALDFLAVRNCFHRDVKPSNILLNNDCAKLSDPGLLKFVGGSDAQHSTVGDWAYAPPESQIGEQLHESHDLYCLAATYVHLRTGGRPFGDASMRTLALKRSRKPQLEGLDEGEVEPILQALSPDPEDRFVLGRRDRHLAWVDWLANASGVAATARLVDAEQIMDWARGDSVRRAEALSRSVAERESELEASKRKESAARRESLQLAAEEAIYRGGWEEAHRYNQSILDLWPDDARAAERRARLRREFLPERDFQAAVQFLSDSLEQVGRTRVLAATGVVALAGIALGVVLLLVSFGFALNSDATFPASVAAIVGAPWLQPVAASLYIVSLCAMLYAASGDLEGRGGPSKHRGLTVAAIGLLLALLYLGDASGVFAALPMAMRPSAASTSWRLARLAGWLGSSLIAGSCAALSLRKACFRPPSRNQSCRARSDVVEQLTDDFGFEHRWQEFRRRLEQEEASLFAEYQDVL